MRKAIAAPWPAKREDQRDGHDGGAGGCDDSYGLSQSLASGDSDAGFQSVRRRCWRLWRGRGGRIYQPYRSIAKFHPLILASDLSERSGWDHRTPHRRTSCRASAQLLRKSRLIQARAKAAIWQYQLKFSTRFRSTQRLRTRKASTGSFVRRRTRGGGTNSGAGKVPRRQRSDCFHQPDGTREEPGGKAPARSSV